MRDLASGFEKSISRQLPEGTCEILAGCVFDAVCVVGRIGRLALPSAEPRDEQRRQRWAIEAAVELGNQVGIYDGLDTGMRSWVSEVS